jgi:cytochrome c-type biogenesis protein CcmH
MGLGGIGRHAEAVQAWRRVMQLSNDAPEYAAQFGESLTMATSGAVTPEALAQFERARAADPQDARARFYIGLARVQAGDPRAGLQVWVDMVAGAPADAPWLAEVRARIAQTAREAGIDPATIAPSPEARAQAAARPPAPPRAPAPPDGQALGNIPPEQRAQIRGMVEGLAARLESSPDDLDGWRRLGRSWLVLGERDRARAAYARAAALAPDNVAVLADYAQTWTDELDEGQPLPAEYAALMRRILALDPDFPEALWSVGLAEMAAGNRAAAIALWERLVAHLPAGSPQAAAIRARIEQLRAP